VNQALKGLCENTKYKISKYKISIFLKFRKQKQKVFKSPCNGRDGDIYGRRKTWCGL